MKQFLYLAGFLLIFNANLARATDITCMASVTNYSSNTPSDIRAELKTEFENQESYLMSSNIGEVHFAISSTKSTDTYLISIAEGPDFLNGVNSSSSFGETNRIQLSWVKGSLVYKIECLK